MPNSSSIFQFPCNKFGNNLKLNASQIKKKNQFYLKENFEFHKFGILIYYSFCTTKCFTKLDCSV